MRYDNDALRCAVKNSLQGGPQRENTAFCLWKIIIAYQRHKIVRKVVKNFKQDVRCVRRDLHINEKIDSLQYLIRTTAAKSQN